MNAAVRLPEIAPARAAFIDRSLRTAETSLETLWHDTGAARFVATIVTADAIRAQAAGVPNPERARLSIIPPEPEIVAEICERAVRIGSDT